MSDVGVGTIVDLLSAAGRRADPVARQRAARVVVELEERAPENLCRLIHEVVRRRTYRFAVNLRFAEAADPFCDSVAVVFFPNIDPDIASTSAMTKGKSQTVARLS